MGHNAHLSEQLQKPIQHFGLSVAMATNQNEEFVQLLCYSTNIYKNVLSKLMHLQWDSNEDQLSLFSLYVNGNFKLPKQRKHMSNGNKKHKFCRG